MEELMSSHNLTCGAWASVSQNTQQALEASQNTGAASPEMIDSFKSLKEKLSGLEDHVLQLLSQLEADSAEIQDAANIDSSPEQAIASDDTTANDNAEAANEGEATFSPTQAAELASFTSAISSIFSGFANFINMMLGGRQPNQQS
jgi:hypothetical protein